MVDVPDSAIALHTRIHMRQAEVHAQIIARQTSWHTLDVTECLRSTNYTVLLVAHAST
jgi:hypothetical protein